MEWITIIVFAIVLCVSLYKFSCFKVEGLTPFFFSVVFILKCICGIMFSAWMLKTGRGGDMHWYMYETNFLFDSCREQPLLFFKYIFGIEDAQTIKYTGIITTWNKADFLVNDARTLLRINLVFRLISLGYLNVHTVIFCFLSTTGFIYFTKFFKAVIKQHNVFLLAVICLAPSVFLWTSLVLKESLLIFFLGCFLFALHQFISLEFSKGRLIMVLLLLFFLLLVKSFVILILLPALLAFYLSKGESNRKLIAFKWTTVYVFCFLLAVTIGNISQNYSLPHQLYKKQEAAMKFAVYRGDKSYYNPPIIADSWISVIKNTPVAVADVFTKPELKSGNTLLTNLAVVENYFYLLLFLAAIIFSIKSKTMDLNFLLLFLLFAIAFFAVTGFSTAVSGAMVRYKITGIVFLMAFCFHSCSKFLKYKTTSMCEFIVG